jgi:hypothetical protein
MPRQARNDQQESFLKFSTLSNAERWWRAAITAEDLRWVQQNLGYGLDGKKRFRTVPSNVALTGSLYPGCPWSDRVVFVEGESAPRVLIGLGDEYNYHSAYSESRKNRDPYLSPHGLFRHLRAGYHKHAFQFMEQFGPLFIESETRFPGVSWWLSLGDFWDKHARFVAVAKLWEHRLDPEQLRADWVSLEEQHEKLDRAGNAPLGYIPDPIQKYIPLSQMPWQCGSDQARLFYTNPSMRRKLVYALVHSELILHTQDCVLTWAETQAPPRDGLSPAVSFEPTRSFTSLWGAIWELFGLDTRQYGWRLCPLCGKLFYPKDHRSVCCSTEHQSLWSKREWAKKHRILIRKAKVEKLRKRR